jgi:hypothetical protein
MNPAAIRHDCFNQAANHVQAQNNLAHGAGAPSALAEQLRAMGGPPEPCVQIKTLRPKENKIAIAFSSKGRFDLTDKTLIPLLAHDVDVFWIDGTPPGPERDKSFEFYECFSGLKEIHRNVGGGPDAAIQYALNHLYLLGYEYIGLLENDVLLQPGWFEKTMGLFDTPGLDVGAVSARCLQNRILKPMNGFAIMSNVGAGNIIFRREMAQLILWNYLQPQLWMLQMVFDHKTGIPYPIPTAVKRRENWQAHLPAVVMSCDWWFEAVMLAHDHYTLAPTPSMAIDLDPKVEDAPVMVATMEAAE